MTSKPPTFAVASRPGADPTLPSPYRQARLLQNALAPDKMRVGFFIGAGCPLAVSVPAALGGWPLIPDIAGVTNKVRSTVGTAAAHKGAFAKILQHLGDSPTSPKTVEDVLSRVRALIDVVGTVPFDGMARHDLVELDKAICREIDVLMRRRLPDKSTPYHQLAAWIGSIPRTHPVEIFTSNYDLLMEQALEESGVPYFDGFSGSDRTFFDVPSMEQLALPPRWARLWKVHGSINWWRTADGDIQRRENGGPDEQQMIHPSHLKFAESRKMPYLAMQDRLRAFLARDQAVLVTCGYSFLDEHLNHAILDGLGHTDLYGVVSQVGASPVPPTADVQTPYGRRSLTVQLVGEGRRGARFTRGLSQHPTIDDRVHIVTELDLRAIYGPGDLTDFVKVGHLASAESIPALVDITKLVTRHSAIVGTTGAGKSNTVAGVLQALADKDLYPSSRIVVLDVHGEYGRALRHIAEVFRVDADHAKGERSLFVPYWALEWEEFRKICLGAIETKDLGPVQDRFLAAKRAACAKHARAGVALERVTVDSLVPFSAHQFWYDLHCEMAATHVEVKGKPQSRDTWAIEADPSTGKPLTGDPMSAIPPTFRAIKDIKDDPDKVRLSSSPLSARRQADALGSKLRDPRFDFMFRPGDWMPSLDGGVKADLDALLMSWLGGARPISVLDLSGIPPTVLTDLIGALLRVIYSAMFWARRRSESAPSMRCESRTQRDSFSPKT